jgi:riboflavin synthase
VFTGIVEARGKIKSIDRHGAFVRLVIETGMDLTDVREGDSISVNGACLTATSADSTNMEFAADVSPETLGVTTLGDLKTGASVNLEKALRLDSRLGGHLVAGHVDCVGRIVEKRLVGDGYLFGFTVDSGRYLIDKGSVAIDGVSLTVNAVRENRFWVMIIPHTALLTGLTHKNVGDKVNVEYDLIGKYIEKFTSSRGKTSTVDENTLREHGFL